MPIFPTTINPNHKKKSGSGCTTCGGNSNATQPFAKIAQKTQEPLQDVTQARTVADVFASFRNPSQMEQYGKNYLGADINFDQKETAEFILETESLRRQERETAKNAERKLTETALREAKRPQIIAGVSSDDWAKLTPSQIAKKANTEEMKAFLIQRGKLKEPKSGNNVYTPTYLAKLIKEAIL